MKTLLPTTTLFLLLLSGALATPAPADMGNMNMGNMTGDMKLREQKKTIEPKIEAGGKKVTLTMKFANDSLKYRSDFSFGTVGFPQTGARFMLRDNDTEDFFGFRVGLLGLAEVGGSSTWNVHNSTNAIKFIGSTQFWSPINITNLNNTGNVTVKKISSTYSNTHMGKNVKVTLDAFIGNDKVTVGNFTVRPYSLKYGLTVENFPFQYSDARLAIVKGVSYKVDLKDDFSTNNGSLSIQGGRGRFNWTSSVDYTFANGTTFTDMINPDPALVLNTTEVNMPVQKNDDPERKEGEGMKIIVFRTKPGNYSKISWDPDVVLNEDALAMDDMNTTTTTGGTTKKSGAALTTASVGLSLLVLIATVFVNFY